MNSSNDELNKLNTALCDTTDDHQIDLQEFLDFLLLAYRINDILTTDKEKNVHDSCIDWTEISRNNLFLRLSDKKYEAAEDDVGILIMHSTRTERVQCILKHKLKDIMNEGILDSVLPFIVKKTLTTNVFKTFESIGSKISNNSFNKDKICSKLKCNMTDNSSRSKGE